MYPDMLHDVDPSISIRPLTTDDLPWWLQLTSENGWNQTRADLERFLALEPAGCAVAEWASDRVATAAAFAFGHVGWIAMILVTRNARRRGLGTVVTRHAIAYLQSRGVRCIRLDATPLGRPVYEKLGFLPQYELCRFRGIARGGKPDPRVTPLHPADLPRVFRFDRQVTGTDRARLLGRLYEESPSDFHIVRRADTITGYLASRAGASGRQIGPGIAVKRWAGEALLANEIARHAGQPIVVDIPHQNRTATAWAAGRGLACERRLIRMFRGAALADQPSAIWASSGPEKG